MKKQIKKIGALVLAGVLALGMSMTALAEADFDSGKAGTWTERDTPIPQDKSINIKKELLSFNASSTSVYAPTFAYKYIVKPASVTDLKVTDEADKHNSGVSVEAPVKAGITAGLTVNGGTAGDAAEASGLLEFTNSNVLATTSTGGSNLYNVTLDFTGVTFEQPGVYRYEITEALNDTATYDGIAVEDGGSNVRYLDVYVDGSLNIYGYVCMAENASVTSATAKTNGFVSDSNGADKYYTYDLTLSKKVENDTYGKGHAFPYTVIFNNTENYTTTFTITETASTGSTGINPTAAFAPTWSGVAKVKEGADIVYTGIPSGVDVDVYETNDMTGVTYSVATSVNDGTPVVDNSVISGTAPTEASAQTTKADYQSTKATVDTTKIAAIAAAQTLAITNTLVIISPTGVALRFAPYAVLFVAGLALLFIFRRRDTEED